MQAAVSDLVPPEARVRAFGLLYWVINMGYAVGATRDGPVVARNGGDGPGTSSQWA
ncbi:MAG: hypothetical protein ABIS67_02095 [Candidatus Eisenbacteria bacterium]